MLKYNFFFNFLDIFLQVFWVSWLKISRRYYLHKNSIIFAKVLFFSLSNFSVSLKFYSILRWYYFLLSLIVNIHAYLNANFETWEFSAEYSAYICWSNTHYQIRPIFRVETKFNCLKFKCVYNGLSLLKLVRVLF